MSVQPLYQTNLPPEETPRVGLNRLVNLDTFSAFSHAALILYTLFAALSIAVSQIAIVSMLVFGIVAYGTAGRAQRAELFMALVNFRFGKLMAAAMVTWLGAAAIAAIVGINAGRSLSELATSALYMLFPFAVSASVLLHSPDFFQSMKRIRLYLTLLVIGQCVAALHSIASAVAQAEIRPGVPGPVTESGQLVLVLPALFALLLISDMEQSRTYSNSVRAVRDLGAIIITICCFIIAWPEIVPAPGVSAQTIRLSALAAVILDLLILIALYLKTRSPAAVWYAPAIALLFSALVINLKRGPWMGVFAEMILLSLFISRKFFLAALTLALAGFAVLVPVRDRIESLLDHFVIEGGRRSMWSIGMDLVQRFPLGLGLNNAQHMRTIEPSLPPLHRHMHNNILNIAVETGWIGMAAYIWWMSIVIMFGFILWRYLSRMDAVRSEIWRVRGLIALCLSSALFGWQVSGLVEYNFGDGEVQFIALLYMGILLAIGASMSGGSESHGRQVSSGV